MEQITPVDVIKAPDEVSVKDIILKIGSARRYLSGKWFTILVAACIGGVCGILIVTLEKPAYTAECTFVLEDSDKGSSIPGQYSAIASMVGIDLGSSSGLFQGDNIVQLYKSRLMLEKTLLSNANFFGKSELLIDRYIQINKLREKWNDNPQLRNINFDIPVQNFTLQHDSLITLIVTDLNKEYLTVDRPDKKLSIISVKIKSADQLFSQAFTNNIVSNVNSFYIQTKTKGSQQNVNLLQHQLDSVRKTLNSSIGGTAAAIDANPNPNPEMQILKVPSQRKQVDVESSIAIYTEVIKNLEVAKSVLQRETPLIQVIDKPVLPLINSNMGRLKAAIIGSVLFVIFMMTFLILKRLYNNIIS